MYALRDITHNMNEIIKIEERFYTRLYACGVIPRDTTRRMRVAREVPRITKDKAENDLKGMKRGKTVGDDGITIDNLKEEGDIILEKLSALFSECLNILTVPIARENANIIPIHNKRDTKDLTTTTP